MACFRKPSAYSGLIRGSSLGRPEEAGQLPSAVGRRNRGGREMMTLSEMWRVGEPLGWLVREVRMEIEARERSQRRLRYIRGLRVLAGCFRINREASK